VITDGGQASPGQPAAPGHPGHGVVRRRVAAVCAAVALLAGLAQPLAGVGRYDLWAQALQYCLLALAAPPLVVLALSRRDRLVKAWRIWPALVVTIEMATLIVWRTPPAVDGVAGHPWLAPLEAATLLFAGLLLWPILLPRPGSREAAGLEDAGATMTPAGRIAASAVCMWTVWITAYLAGFSSAQWYPDYSHRGGLSPLADQQLTTGILFVGAAAAFMPVIFWCLFAWLAPSRPDRMSHAGLAAGGAG